MIGYAISQPLPIPTLQEAMQQIFVVADFDSGNLKMLRVLLHFSPILTTQLIDTRSQRNFPFIAFFPK